MSRQIKLTKWLKFMLKNLEIVNQYMIFAAWFNQMINKV